MAFFYTADPARDALEHDDAMEAAQDATEHALAAVTKEIQQLFTRTLRTVPLQSLSAPCTSSLKPGRAAMPLAEAIDDCLIYAGPQKALLEVICTSDCPSVERLRQAMADHWVKSWADAVAEAA